MASPTILIFSACSSGMVISNSSSSSMTSSTMSRESAPTSSVKEVERVTCSLFTPRFSQTISITRSSVEGTIGPSQSGSSRPANGGGRSQQETIPPWFMYHSTLAQGKVSCRSRKGGRENKTLADCQMTSLWQNGANGQSRKWLVVSGSD